MHMCLLALVCCNLTAVEPFYLSIDMTAIIIVIKSLVQDKSDNGTDFFIEKTLKASQDIKTKWALKIFEVSRKKNDKMRM